MAGRNQPPYRPRGGVNFSSSSSRSFHPSRNSTKNVNSEERKKTSSSNWDNKAAINGDIDDIQNLPSLVGTCPFMCPVEEREKRERLRDLAVFERLYGNPAKSSPSLAVKKFCRTISGKTLQDSDVRPLSVLEDTLSYLSNLLDSTEHPFEVVHDFIFDRMRSIRQDLSMQNIACSRVVSMYERMGETLSLWFRRVPSHIMKSTEMNFARKILRYFKLGFYKKFIHITESEASYLQYCIIEPSISEVRALAISCVNYGGYKLQPFPLAALSKFLMMKEWELESFCNDSGLQTSIDEEGNSCLPTKQTTLIHPKGGLHKYYPLESERFDRYTVVSNALKFHSMYVNNFDIK
ncbi:PREDICTED: SAC3 family protein C isoform X3 [Nicotiana attenuata]|uniref:SAC3 family protein C isoform X3 n=1 Tax=Nicotiana attenuata TaxID=49451 RepID=UPI0009046B59|nr:PREDICTED: SAC3 family protein C isoform X3 [Nicotiana attenuata]